ncbi:hypothetical protein Nepgr_033166 [Nepenthes gracilis]|uniref:Pyruvate dehydrogenase E1 component subunit alpha n=1 Tax=Nepenthes gracilis TaxID=150966 RepID=A0AAD3TK06_NEPGR|nr:hypothetical protein Nepgr_033166 [Nepenthes gracilis]
MTISSIYGTDLWHPRILPPLGGQHSSKTTRQTCQSSCLVPLPGNLLASGGGGGDGCIKFWNTHTWCLLEFFGSWIAVHCLALWSKNEREPLSSHGFTRNQPILWKYPSMLITKQEGLELYEDLVLGRSFEDMCAQMYYRGKMFGFVHLYNGQEAVSSGFIKLLRKDDCVVSTYRDHVHALSKGVPARAAMSELSGKTTGCCRGQGGSMHMFSKEHNVLGGFAFIGEGIPIATGAAFSMKYKRELLNENCDDDMAVLWKLPIIFVMENNLWAIGMSHLRATSVPEIWKKGPAFGMPGVHVDGMDVLKVRNVAMEAITRARRGEGPTLVESEKTHYAARDPIKAFKKYLLENSLADEAELKAIEKKIDELVEDSVEFADQSCFPTREQLLENVFSDPKGFGIGPDGSYRCEDPNFALIASFPLSLPTFVSPLLPAHILYLNAFLLTSIIYFSYLIGRSEVLIEFINLGLTNCGNSSVDFVIQQHHSYGINISQFCIILGHGSLAIIPTASPPKKDLKRKCSTSFPVWPKSDAPDLLDDFYLNRWIGVVATFAIALGSTVYLWDASSGSTSELVMVDDENGPVTSVSWAPDGKHIAVGLNNSEVQLWDSTAIRQVGTEHELESLAWNNHILTTGGMDGRIINNDRAQPRVCGLKWSASSQQASRGGNDNLLHIWDGSMASSNLATTRWLQGSKTTTAVSKLLLGAPSRATYWPLVEVVATVHQILEHPHWCLNYVNLGSQCMPCYGVRMSVSYLALMGLLNQAILWKYPSMVKMAELTGHTSRVLFMAQVNIKFSVALKNYVVSSPDGCRGGLAGDETLGFWNVFGTLFR